MYRQIQSYLKVSSTTREYILVLFVYASITLIVWIPFGFNDVTGGEEWNHLALNDAYGFEIDGSRPLLRLVFYISSLLTPDRLQGFIVLLLCMFFKCVACYGLLRLLVPSQPSLAFSVGALILVFPIENVTYQLTYLNYHFVAFTLFSSTFILIWCYIQPRWWKVAIMWVLLLPTTFIVEATFPLLAIAPLLMLWKERRFTRKFFAISGLWYLVPIIGIVNLAGNALFRSDSVDYQSGVIYEDNSIGTLIEVMTTIFRGHFWDRWLLPSVELPSENLNPGYVILSMIAFAIIFGSLMYLSKTETQLRTHQIFTIFITGVISLIFGYIVFIITIYRLSFIRTTFFSIPGAAVVIVSFIIAVAQRPYWVRAMISILGSCALVIFQIVPIQSNTPLTFAELTVIVALTGLLLSRRIAVPIIIASLITISLLYTLVIRQTYRDTDFNTEFLEQIPPLIPVIAPNTALIIVVDSDKTPLALSHNRFTNYLGWLYEEYSLKGYFCAINQPSSIDRTTCSFDMVSAMTSGVGSTGFQTTYDRVIFLRFSAADRSLTLWDEEEIEAWIGQPIEGYDPYRRIDLNGVPPRRYFTLFS
jgi:hypothetical protein